MKSRVLPIVMLVLSLWVAPSRAAVPHAGEGVRQITITIDSKLDACCGQIQSNFQTVFEDFRETWTALDEIASKIDNIQCSANTAVIESKLDVCCANIENNFQTVFEDFSGTWTAINHSQVVMLSAINGCCGSVGSKLDSCCFTLDSKLDSLDLKLLGYNLCTPVGITGPTTITSAGAYCLANDIEGSITLLSTTTGVVIDMNGHIINAAAASYGIQIISQSDVNIYNGRIIGTNGVYATECQNLSFNNVYFACAGQGIELINSKNVGINRCKFVSDSTGSLGVHTTGCDVVSFFDIFCNIDLAGLLLESTTNIRGETVQLVSSNPQCTGIRAETCSNIVFKNLTSTVGDNVVVNAGANVTIEGAEITGGNGITCSGASILTFNDLSLESCTYGIRCKNGSIFKLNNTEFNTCDLALSLTSMDQLVTIGNCTAVGSAAVASQHVFYLENCANPFIHDCRLNNNGLEKLHVLYLLNCPNTTINNVECSYNHATDLALIFDLQSSNGSMLTNCVATNNQGLNTCYAFNIAASSSCMLTNCIASGHYNSNDCKTFNVDNSSDVVMQNCKSYANTSDLVYGFYVNNSSNRNKFFDCLASNPDTSQSYGFSINNVEETMIVRCIATNNKRNGFELKTCYNSEIKECQALYNTTTGFYDDTMAGNNQFYKNIACNNGTNYNGVIAAPIKSPADVRGLDNADCAMTEQDLLEVVDSKLDACCTQLALDLQQTLTVLGNRTDFSIDPTTITTASEVDQLDLSIVQLVKTVLRAVLNV